MLEEGQEVGGYTIGPVLEEGDMGRTYRVSREGAVFVLPVLEYANEAFRERLRRAGEAQRDIDHPNVVSVREVIETPDGPGLVSEFIEGENLEQWIARGPHPVPDTLEMFAGILRGLDACHSAGILHRNLKPSKVLISADGVAKVNDFVFGRVDSGADAPRLTALDSTFGTPQFMAPEQFHGAAKVDARADLFSAGCILYEMMTATRAFPGVNLMDIYMAVSQGKFVPIEEARADLPSGVVKVASALLQVKAEDRPQTAGDALEMLLSIEGAAVPPVELGAPPPPETSAEDDAEFERQLAAHVRRRRQGQMITCGCLAFAAAALAAVVCGGWALSGAI